MKKILFATGNQSKAKRFSKGLLDKGIEVVTLADLDLELDIEENGSNAIDNAIIKAKAYYTATGMITMAMDDTLYIDNIPEDKQPGLFVRRVNGKRLNDYEMIEYYSNLAKTYGDSGKLTARWVYGMAIINNGILSTYTWQKNDFLIVSEVSKIVNPGYPLNSISINKKLNKYFTEITEEDKLLIEEDESDIVDFIASNVNETKDNNCD